MAVRKHRFRKTNISGEKIAAFWHDYDRGGRAPREVANPADIRTGQKRPYFDQLGKRMARPVWITKNTLGMVRHFQSRELLEEHLKTVENANRIFANAKTFEFIPTEIIAVDNKRLRIVERVIPAPNYQDVQLSAYNLRNLKKFSRYGDFFVRRMKKRGISVEGMPERIMDPLRKAVTELKTTQRKHPEIINLDPIGTNIIVVDFDKETMKPVLALIDHTSEPR